MKKLIGIILIFICWQNAFSALSHGEEHIAWWYIRAKFMGESKHPVIYRTDIAIKLEGERTPMDWEIINEIIAELKRYIPDRKIFLTSTDANLILNFTDKKFGTGQILDSKIGSSIISKTIEVSFPSHDISMQARKDILYYCLYRALVEFTSMRSQVIPTGPKGGVYFEENHKNIKLPHSVFYEEKPENITYSYYDSFIIKNLYAPDFQERFKKDFVNQYHYRGYLLFMYPNELKISFLLLESLLVIMLLSALMMMGFFNAHHWNWFKYNKQGFFLIICGGIYIFGYCCSSDLLLRSSEIIFTLNYFLIAILAVNVLFLIERLLLKNHIENGMKVIVLFFTTLFVLTPFSGFFSISVGMVGQLGLHSLFLIHNVGAVYTNSYFSDFQLSNFYTYIAPFILIPSLGRSLFTFFNDRYKSIIFQKDVELARINELHKNAELQSLQAKINPHFLYNALNSIASLASTDAKKTEQMALGLSDFFKYSINREQKQLNSLSEELNAIRTYLEIGKVRFGDRLSFEIDCPEELLDIQIPQLLIQPLVENAIKHGLSQITENGMIRISVSSKEKQVKIKIYDNGPAFPEGPLSGYGIQNTQERIALLYGEKASINWYNGDKKHIELILPAEH